MTSSRLAASSAAAWQTGAAVLLLLLMLLPSTRRMSESSMTAHMLIQYPSLMLVGGLCMHALPPRWLSGAQRWNELGIAGLVGSGLTLAVLMVPRVLDLALVDGHVETLKLIALVASGAALRLSWQRAGVVLQAFFLGNVLGMTAVVGILYQDAAVRVCNAYRLDDQQNLGLALVWISIAIAAIWALHLGWRRARSGADLRIGFATAATCRPPRDSRDGAGRTA